MGGVIIRSIDITKIADAIDKETSAEKGKLVHVRSGYQMKLKEHRIRRSIFENCKLAEAQYYHFLIDVTEVQKQLKKEKCDKWDLQWHLMRVAYRMLVEFYVIADYKGTQNLDFVELSQGVCAELKKFSPPYWVALSSVAIIKYLHLEQVTEFNFIKKRLVANYNLLRKELD